MTKPRRCKDCASGSRPLVPDYPGPRCATHARAHRKHRGELAHTRRLASVYELTPERYKAILAAQDGVCAICRVANGRTKRLAVDHDHDTGEIRGLLCGPDNLMIGRLRAEGLLRAIEYLYDPPARKVL